MITKILFATDFAPTSNKAFKYALNLKDKYQIELIILNVNEEFLDKDEMIMSRVGVEKAMKTNEEIALQTKEKFYQMLSDLGISDSLDIQIVQRAGNASKEIINYAENINSDFIIIGSNGHSKISELLLGSTAKSVINNSKVPVLVIPLGN